MVTTIDFDRISTYKTPEHSPGYLLWRINTQWRTAIETVLKRYDLTHPQFVVLASLGWLTRKTPHISQVEIGRAAGLDPNTLSQIIRGLEAKKMIKRVQKIDARSKNPVLTSMGSDVLARALPAVEAADAEFFSPLTPAESDALLMIFQKLIKQ